MQKLQDNRTPVLPCRQMREKGVDGYGQKNVVVFPVSGDTCRMRRCDRDADGKNVWISA